MSAGTRGTEPRQLRTLLPPALRRLLAFAIALAFFMLADTLYLLLIRLAGRVGLRPFALGAESLPGLYQILLLAHTGAGLLLSALMLVFLVAHLPRVWVRYHREAAWTGAPYAALGVVLSVSGLFILTAAANEENNWAWWLHAGAAVLAVAGYVAHRAVSYTRPPATRVVRFLGASAAASMAFFVIHGAVALGGPDRPPRVLDVPGVDIAGSVSRDVGALLGGDFGPSGWVPTGAVPPESPFFPSPATTTTGRTLPASILAPGEPDASAEAVAAEAAARGFVVDTNIGAESCVRCHADIVEQWATSAHRFASFNNPFYEATIVAMRKESLEPNRWIERHLASLGAGIDDEVGRARSKWCGGCHDPVLMLGGSMQNEIDRTSIGAQAGLTCMSCHAIDRVHDRTGNGNYNIADRSGDPYILSSSPAGSVGRFLHDTALKARPAVHAARMLKPFFRTSSYCATCHKVSLTEPVNGYRWLRGQNEFDSWDDSGVSFNAARTFYLPESPQNCQDCHMPLEPAPQDLAAANGMVRSHRFPAANTALPFVRGDTATLRRIEDYLRAGKLRIDIFAVRVANMELPVPLASGESQVPAATPVTFDVVVRNLGVGHTFPGGTNDSNEGWIEFILTDSAGRPVAVSGLIGDDGRLDPFAHTFKSVLVDRTGNAIDRRNAQDIHTTVYANVVGPGSADLAHYELTLPATLAGSTLTLTARLLWRKFDRAYSDFAFASNPHGFRAFDASPELPITEIASDTVRIVVAGAASDIARTPDSPDSDWTRHNDYGIALLLEGDTRRAARAFTRVEELVPGRIDGPLNLARTALAEGNLGLAYEALDRSEGIEAGNPRAAWVWGQALQEDGRYGDAVLAYQRVLQTFPGDRATWRALGRTLFLDGRHEEALTALAQVLEIDPEDRVAHYHRMLALRALGRDGEAARAEAAYLYYAVDEAAQEVTLAYRAREPGANIMAQPIPVHRLEVIR